MFLFINHNYFCPYKGQKSPLFFQYATKTKHYECKIDKKNIPTFRIDGRNGQPYPLMCKKRKDSLC